MARQKWRDKYRAASFRGVRFFVDVSNFEGGRRGPLHEFTDRDEPFKEDTGRAARKYPTDGYVLGTNYLDAKRKLIAALEKKGPGDLIHPYYGKVRVCVDQRFTVRESRTEGGIARFSMPFVEAGKVKFPKSGLDPRGLVEKAQGALDAAASADFAENFSILEQAAFVVNSATEKVQAFADRVDAATAGISATADQIAELAFSVRNLKSTVNDLISKPTELAAKIMASLDLLVVSLDPSDVLDTVKQIFNFGDDDASFPRTTASREQQYRNQISINTLIQVFAVSRASTAAANVTFKSTDEAIAEQAILTNKIDALSENPETSDTVYTTLQEIRAQVVQAVPDITQGLASVTDLQIPATTNSIVLAYELNKSLDDEQDLIDRNRLRHPGFVVGGSTIEVLDRG